MNKSKAKLLYITSFAHSGSTLLDLLCGSLPNMFSLGEAHWFSWQLLRGASPEDPQSYCSCGKSFDQCEFWSEILKQLSEMSGTNIIKDPKKYNFTITRHIERYDNKLYYRILNKLFSIFINYRILTPFSYLIYLIYKAPIKRNWILYDKVAEKANVEYIVDSSKDFFRFWLLRMHRPKDTKLIILKRDIKGTVSTKYGGFNMTILKQRATHWIKFYYQKIKPAFKFMNPDDWMYIKYEDLCKDPNKIRNEIAQFVGMPKPEKPFEYISPYKYHTILGNPMRLNKEDIVIKYDERWKERLNEEEIRWLDELLMSYK